MKYYPVLTVTAPPVVNTLVPGASFTTGASFPAELAAVVPVPEGTSGVSDLDLLIATVDEIFLAEDQGPAHF